MAARHRPPEPHQTEFTNNNNNNLQQRRFKTNAVFSSEGYELRSSMARACAMPLGRCQRARPRAGRCGRTRLRTPTHHIHALPAAPLVHLFLASFKVQQYERFAKASPGLPGPHSTPRPHKASPGRTVRPGPHRGVRGLTGAHGPFRASWASQGRAGPPNKAAPSPSLPSAGAGPVVWASEPTLSRLQRGCPPVG